MVKIEQYRQVRITKIREDLIYAIDHGTAKVGDVGCVVEVYHQVGLPVGYEVEYTEGGYDNAWMATFYEDEIEPVVETEASSTSET